MNEEEMIKELANKFGKMLGPKIETVAVGGNKATHTITYSVPFTATQSFFSPFMDTISHFMRKWEISPEKIKVNFKDRKFDNALNAIDVMLKESKGEIDPEIMLQKKLERIVNWCDKEIEDTDKATNRGKQELWKRIKPMLEFNLKTRTMTIDKDIDFEQLRIIMAFKPILLCFKVCYQNKTYTNWIEYNNTILNFDKLTEEQLQQCFDHWERELE